LGEAIVIGALAVTGAATATSGETLVERTCAAPTEPRTRWSPDELRPEAGESLPPADADAPPLRVALPPLFGDATVTGALTVAGAEAAAAGEASAFPTWAEATEPDVF
jgi:hypothetical protein